MSGELGRGVRKASRRKSSSPLSRWGQTEGTSVLEQMNLEGGKLSFLGVAWLGWRELLRKSHLLCRGIEGRAWWLRLLPGASEELEHTRHQRRRQRLRGLFLSPSSVNLVFPSRPGPEQQVLNKPHGHPQFRLRGVCKKAEPCQAGLKGQKSKA